MKATLIAPLQTRLDAANAAIAALQTTADGTAASLTTAQTLNTQAVDALRAKRTEISLLQYQIGAVPND